MTFINNYHTHTTRCNHAYGTDREYVEAAIAAGFQKLGFSDHVPVPFRSNYYSHIRMHLTETGEYIESIRELAKEYASDIQLFVGFEAEYMPDLFQAQMKFLSDYDFDYLILGSHFVESEETGFYSGDPTDREEDLRRYVDNTINGLKTGVYSYLAHPDLMNFTGSAAIYEKHMSRLCLAAKELHLPLEINLNGLVGDRHYPTDAFFQLASSLGAEICLGIDAHHPDLIGNQEMMKKAEDFIARNHLTVVEDIPLRSPYLSK